MRAMKRLTWKSIIIFLIVAFIVLVVDRLIKVTILSYFTEDIVVIPHILRITLEKNTGVAFGIALPYFFQLALIPSLFIFGMYLVLEYLNVKSLLVQIVVGCIAGGAISNFIDRLIYQNVIDYISISIYPVFNLADAFITVGIFILVLFYGKIKRV